MLNIENDTKHRILNILYNDPSLVLMLKERYVDDEVLMFCIEREPSIFKKLERPSKKVCNYAIEVDGYNLKYIVSKFNYVKITDKMVYDAVLNCPTAILSVPKKMINHGLKELAFDADPSLIQYFDNIRPEYLKERIHDNPAIIQYIHNPDEDLVCSALIQNPNICVYIEKLTPKMEDTMEQYYPNVLALYTQMKRDKQTE